MWYLVYRMWYVVCRMSYVDLTRTVKVRAKLRDWTRTARVRAKLLFFEKILSIGPGNVVILLALLEIVN